MRRDVFQAEIIHLIAGKSPNLNAVADNFNVSRPAISKHVKIMQQCGLLTIRQQGPERNCEARLERLNEVSDWVAQYQQF